MVTFPLLSSGEVYVIKDSVF